MVKSPVSPAEKITAEEFAEYLGKYPACIEAISKSKGGIIHIYANISY